MPLTLQMPAHPSDASAIEEPSTFRSPISVDHSQFSSGAFNQSSERRAGKTNQSLDVSGRSRKKDSGLSGQRINMPGAPFLEGTASQKQFIIKKGKVKRNSSKGASMIKAYFPSVIAKKDV